MSAVEVSGKVNEDSLDTQSQNKKMAITVKDERRTLKTLQLTPDGKLSGEEPYMAITVKDERRTLKTLQLTPDGKLCGGEPYMAITVKDERRTLKTLQLTPDGKLCGGEKKPAKNLIQTKIFPSIKPVKVFENKPRVPSPLARSFQASPESSEVEVQVELEGAGGGRDDAHNDSGVGADQEAYDLLVKDPIPESYWRELAEERRLCLAEALAENKALHQSVEEMKEENLNLSLLASQAEHLASILDDALSSDGDATENTSEPTADQNKDDEQQTQTSKTIHTCRYLYEIFTCHRDVVHHTIKAHQSCE